jgi:hypothetical protein
MKTILAIIAVFLSACSVTPRSTTLEPRTWHQIQVSRRLWFIVCTGACSQFDLTITAAGDVVSRSYISDPDKATIYRYRIAPKRAAQFEQILRPLKPQASIAAPRVCTHPEITGPERELIRTDVVPLKIRWQNGSTTELSTCGESSRFRETLRLAMREIRLWPSGDVICHLSSGEESLCTLPGVVDAPHMEGWGLECPALDEPAGNGPTLEARECRLRKLDAAE